MRMEVFLPGSHCYQRHLESADGERIKESCIIICKLGVTILSEYENHLPI